MIWDLTPLTKVAVQFQKKKYLYVQSSIETNKMEKNVNNKAVEPYLGPS